MTITDRAAAWQKSRIPFDSQYVRELGTATYIFSYLEWGVVCCIDCLELGYAANPKKGTAGNIAEKFTAVVKRSQALTPEARLSAEYASNKFSRLIDARNRLVHANPYTSAGGNQQLLYNGKSGWQDWSVDEIQAIAMQFEELAIEVNDLFHGHLVSLNH